MHIKKEMYINKTIFGDKYNRYESFPDDFYNPYPKSDPYPKQSYGTSVNSELIKIEKQVAALNKVLNELREKLNRVIRKNEQLENEVTAKNEVLLDADEQIKELTERIEAMQDFSRFDAMIVEEE